MAITRVNHTYSDVSNTLTPAITIPAATTGNLLVILYLAYAQTNPTVAWSNVIGNAGTVFQQATGSTSTNNQDGPATAQMWYGTAAGADTSISANFTDAVASIDCFVFEYNAGAGLVFTFLSAAGLTNYPNGTSSIVGPSIVLSNTLSLIVGSQVDDSTNSVSVSSPFNYLTTLFGGVFGDDGQGPTDLLNAVAGTYQPTMTLVGASGNPMFTLAAWSAAASSTVYSQPDSRNYATFPNSSRSVNGTLIYDVQTSSNPAVPGTDSRTAGAPVASGTYPQNSRTPGTFGPGE
jgi:hypothetical protein